MSTSNVGNTSNVSNVGNVGNTGNVCKVGITHRSTLSSALAGFINVFLVSVYNLLISS